MASAALHGSKTETLSIVVGISVLRLPWHLMLGRALLVLEGWYALELIVRIKDRADKETFVSEWLSRWE